jgi:hypothetical protein
LPLVFSIGQDQGHGDDVGHPHGSIHLMCLAVLGQPGLAAAGVSEGSNQATGQELGSSGVSWQTGS